ncbi:hypothetical protein A6770_18690 [Nostoc minutum NIES-26]|uniref:Uncharacterized protein n=1 Tax=Nostoc minutum NIES-26 TaxID=1844469 RepID=A0A367RA88_9NOSO|nr:hypothetical protein A6770_18690 [Nostoc minutum NIES-26]
MSTIAVSELNNAGIQLFEDSENFLNDLSDIDSISVYGGGGNGGNGGVSDVTTLTKLAEGFVTVYAVGHIADIAKSFSAIQ